MIKTIVFDFDGLILDTETPDYLSWKETYESFGVAFPKDAWVEQIGTTTFDPYAYLEQLLGDTVDRQAVWTQRKQRDDDLIAAEVVLPGVEAYLAEAKEMGFKIGLASSSRHEWVDAHLQRLGLYTWFDAICCRDDVADRPKPDPAVYQLALKRLEAAPKETMAFEDSPHGVAAAKGAGLWVTAVPNRMTHHLAFDQVDYRLGSLADMPLTQLISEVLRG